MTNYSQWTSKKNKTQICHWFVQTIGLLSWLSLCFNHLDFQHSGSAIPTQHPERTPSPLKFMINFFQCNFVFIFSSETYSSLLASSFSCSSSLTHIYERIALHKMHEQKKESGAPQKRYNRTCLKDLMLLHSNPKTCPPRNIFQSF